MEICVILRTITKKQRKGFDDFIDGARVKKKIIYMRTKKRIIVNILIKRKTKKNIINIILIKYNFIII